MGTADALITIVVRSATYGNMSILEKRKLLWSKLAIRVITIIRAFNVIWLKLGLHPWGENLREFY